MVHCHPKRSCYGPTIHTPEACALRPGCQGRPAADPVVKWSGFAGLCQSTTGPSSSTNSDLTWQPASVYAQVPTCLHKGRLLALRCRPPQPVYAAQQHPSRSPPSPFSAGSMSHMIRAIHSGPPTLGPPHKKALYIEPVPRLLHPLPPECIQRSLHHDVTHAWRTHLQGCG